MAFGDHGLSRPMELLTDAVGRSDYGKIDPTVFMLVTYPLFFGLMLGDMLYGLMTLGLAGLIYSRVKDSGNDLGILGAKLVAYIGLSTVRQPMRDMGAIATQTLLDRMKNERKAISQIIYSPELILRKSTNGILKKS